MAYGVGDAVVGASVRSATAGCTPVEQAAQPAVAVAVPHPLDGDRARRRARRGQAVSHGSAMRPLASSLASRPTCVEG
jgi:hypothetical protein